MGSEPRVLIAVGGYGGVHTALCLEKLPRPGEATVMVAGPRSYLTYQPLLAGAAAGNLEPRHVVLPLRAVLHCAQVIKAAVSSIDHGRRLTPAEGGRIRLDDGEEPRPGPWCGPPGSPSPLARPAGLLTDAAGRVIVSEFLAVDGADGAWAPGDRTAVPDLSGRERRKKMSTMLTTGEQQELRRIEQELRDADLGFAWRLGVFQGMLRWARPGRQAYLLALAVLTVAVLCLVAATRRLPVAFAERAVRVGSAAPMALGDAAWPGWDSGPVPGHGASPQQDRRHGRAMSTAGSTDGLGMRVPPGGPGPASQDMEAVMGS